MAHSILIVAAGGIAAYKIPVLARLLIKKSFSVQTALTQSAENFIGKSTFASLTGKPVLTDDWSAADGSIPHIDATRGVDLVVVAPATANIINKMAAGIADTFASSLLLASRAPILVVPAMNERMWAHPATQRAVSLLKRDGVMFAGPAQGFQACGDTGAGRMIEPEEILAAVESFFAPKDLEGIKALVTAGPTVEKIDPVRVITNSSSGRQGYAVAAELARRGAQVVLVSGPTALEAPAGVRRINVQSAEEMFEAVKNEASGSDVFVGVAAVADYRVVNPHSQKWKKESRGTPFEGLEFEKNPDILDWVGHLDAEVRPFTVGFAAESENIVENAREKLLRKNADFIVANSTSAIGRSDNSVAIVLADEQINVENSGKSVVAERIVDEIAKRIKP